MQPAPQHTPDETPLIAISAEPTPVERPTTPLPVRHLLVLSVYWLGMNAIWAGLHVVVLPKRMEAIFGVGSAGLGLAVVTVAGVLTAIIVQPTIGTISDYTTSRWGRRKPYIVIGTLLDLVFLWAVASADTYIAIVAALVLLQFSSNFAQGPFQGYVPDLVPAEQVGRASGLMGVMIILGSMVGVGLAAIGYVQLQAGAPADVVGQTLFWPTVALGLIELATMIVLVAAVDEGRPGPPRGGRSWANIALRAWGTDILRERSYVWLLVSRLLYLAVPGVISGYTVFVLERSFDLAPAQAFPFLLTTGAIVAVSTLLATLPAARLSDRIGRKRVIYLSFALATVGILGMALSPMLELTLLSMVPIGLSAGAFLTVDWALMTDIIPKATAGRYMGISNVATASSGPLGLAVAGVILYLVTAAGLPAPGAADLESALLGEAPRAAIGSMLVFIAGSAWALRRVREQRRET
ncbi:MAG: MFS transporter [Chloroflexota bacterium]|nr:MFS transporter [Chloroflexota bacterium]